MNLLNCLPLSTVIYGYTTFKLLHSLKLLTLSRRSIEHCRFMPAISLHKNHTISINLKFTVIATFLHNMWNPFFCWESMIYLERKCQKNWSALISQMGICLLYFMPLHFCKTRITIYYYIFLEIVKIWKWHVLFDNLNCD